MIAPVADTQIAFHRDPEFGDLICVKAVSVPPGVVGPDRNPDPTHSSRLRVSERHLDLGVLLLSGPRAWLRRISTMAMKEHPAHEHHMLAATHHAAAAHHHHEAAHHHAHGNAEEAKRHSTSAKTHAEHASRHTGEAHKHTAA